MKVKRRFPNYFSGFDETEHEVSSNGDLMDIEWIKGYNDIPEWMGLYYSPQDSKYEDMPDLLMSLSKEKNKVVYFVVGYIYGDGAKLGLKNYKDYV